jgi:hypothetical protein
MRLHVLLLTGALAVAGGIAVAGDPEPERPAPPAGQAPVQAVEPEQAAAYAALRQPAGDGDNLPPQAVEFIRRSVTGDSGAAPGLVRRARLTKEGLAVYLIPGRDRLCTYITTVGTDGGMGGCGRLPDMLEGRAVSLTNPAPGVTRIVGVLPDGAEEVTLRNEDGSTETAAVEGNVYVFETTALPEAVLWGDREIPVFSPAAKLG